MEKTETKPTAIKLSDNVEVDKGALIETLLLNKADHVASYEEAMARYREKLIDELEETLEAREKWLNELRDALAALKAGGDVEDAEEHVSLLKPVSHADSFDTAIAKLKWALGTTVELNPRDFQQYIMNDWTWRSDFNRTVGFYGVTGPVGSQGVQGPAGITGTEGVTGAKS